MKLVIIVVIIGVILVGTMIMTRPVPVETVSIDFDEIIIIQPVPPFLPVQDEEFIENMPEIRDIDSDIIEQVVTDDEELNELLVSENP